MTTKSQCSESTCTDAQKAVEFFESKLAFEIGPIGLKERIESKESLQIIDLRSEVLYETSHIPGAINLSYDQLVEKLEQNNLGLSKEKTTVLYCYNITCRLSARAALALAKEGYRVKELFGGFDDYAKANLALEGKAHLACSSSGTSCA